MDITGLGAVADFATTVVNKLFPDAGQKEKDEAAQKILEATQQYNLTQGQVEVDKIEAGSSSLLVSGWRPFCGWVGGFGLAYAALLEPLLRFVAKVGFAYVGAFPALDTTITMQVLFGMLGLGAMRSFDKKNGVASK